MCVLVFEIPKCYLLENRIFFHSILNTYKKVLGIFATFFLVPSSAWTFPFSFRFPIDSSQFLPACVRFVESIVK